MATDSNIIDEHAPLAMSAFLLSLRSDMKNFVVVPDNAKSHERLRKTIGPFSTATNRDALLSFKNKGDARWSTESPPSLASRSSGKRHDQGGRRRVRDRHGRFASTSSTFGDSLGATIDRDRRFELPRRQSSHTSRDLPLQRPAFDSSISENSSGNGRRTNNASLPSSSTMLRPTRALGRSGHPHTMKIPNRGEFYEPNSKLVVKDKPMAAIKTDFVPSRGGKASLMSENASFPGNPQHFVRRARTRQENNSTDEGMAQLLVKQAKTRRRRATFPSSVAAMAA